MASDKQFLDYIIEQLSECGGVTYRAMMGEYIIYFDGKTVAGIYDNRFLVKPTESAKRLMPCAAYELPYEGAKPMLLVGETDDRAFLAELIRAVYADLYGGK